MSDNNDRLFGVGRRTFVKGIGAAGLATALSGSASASTADPAENLSLPDRHGPYRKNRFLVEIEGIATAGFSAVKLPEVVVSDVEYREGNGPARDRKLKGSNEFEPLVLERGVTTDSIELYEWFKQVQQGKVDAARRSIAVVVLGEEGESGPRWEFRDAWPARYDAPDLDAMADGVAVETLEILHEGMERVA